MSNLLFGRLLYPFQATPQSAQSPHRPRITQSYPRGLNRASCCRQEICTECFLQLKETPSTCSPCPFCNKENFHVVYLGPKSKAERQTELEELRKVEEAQERMRKEEEKRSAERDAQREKLRREAEEASAALSLSSEDPDTLSSASSSSNTSSNNANPEPAPPADPNYGRCIFLSSVVLCRSFMEGRFRSDDGRPKSQPCGIGTVDDCGSHSIIVG